MLRYLCEATLDGIFDLKLVERLYAMVSSDRVRRKDCATLCGSSRFTSMGEVKCRMLSHAGPASGIGQTSIQPTPLPPSLPYPTTSSLPVPSNDAVDNLISSGLAVPF